MTLSSPTATGVMASTRTNASGHALVLPNDREPDAPLIADHLSDWAGNDAERHLLADVILALASAAPALAERLALGSLRGNPAEIVGTNDSGDKQKALDVAGHDHFISVLATASVHSVLSEEAEAAVELDPAGRFDVAIDPIDGSGSIGIGAPLGTLFGVFPGGGGFLRSGRDMVAAGYISIGHSLDMVFSVGDGVALATYDRSADAFRVTQPRHVMPDHAPSLAYNASNVGGWAEPLQAYVSDCLKGKDGPRGCSFNMRWLAAAVGDLHRIMCQGGVFLYPADARPGYEQGRLRLVYEAFPIAFLMEQCGGAASDGAGPVLDRIPDSAHQNSPLIFGSADEMAVFNTYLTRDN